MKVRLSIWTFGFVLKTVNGLKLEIAKKLEMVKTGNGKNWKLKMKKFTLKI